VFVSGDAVETGIVSRLARPGGNLTGVDIFAEQLDAKRLALLKETLPKAVLVAVLWNPGTPEGKVQRSRLEIAAQAVGVKLRFLGARQPVELQPAFTAMAREHPDALLVSADPMFSGEAERIIGWTARARLPTMYISRNFTDDGAS
jgi:putative ABC transport system substrate-binding protein